MKNSKYLILLFSIALVLIAYRWIYSDGGGVDGSEHPDAVIENIMSRTSVRSYSDRQVAKETMDTLLRAAMAAPTAGNKQPWRFVVIDDKEILRTIGENFSTMSMASEAAAAVIMCGDSTATFGGEGRGYWIQDVSAASENLLLAAHALGLGAVWCGIYPQQDRVVAFSKMLSLPIEVIPMACICIGYPAGETTPKDKWHPEYVHYNSWDSVR